MQYPPNQQGYVTLLSVLVVGAVGIAIAVSLLWLGIGFSDTALMEQQSMQARSLANACAEEGLERVRADTNYVGTGSLALGQGSCSYTVASQGGSNRTVDSIATVSTVIRRSHIVITALNPFITIASWQETTN